MLDTHYHLDFLDKPAQADFAALNATNNINVVAQTLTPSSYVEQANSPTPGPLYSLGYHPWYIKSPEAAEEELNIFDQHVHSCRLIGEIGMDFIPRNLAHASEDLQRHVFTHIIQSVCNAAETAPYVLSIHAVHSATAVLDVLEEHDVFSLNIAPIIHWFSGNSDELTRLIRAGGYVSINPMMLSSKRGRAYAKQVPADRILLETDLPSSKTLDDKTAADHASDLHDGLKHVVDTISELRVEDILPIIRDTQQRLYG